MGTVATIPVILLEGIADKIPILFRLEAHSHDKKHVMQCLGEIVSSHQNLKQVVVERFVLQRIGDCHNESLRENSRHQTQKE